MSLFLRLLLGATLFGTLIATVAQAALSPSDFAAKCTSSELPFGSPEKVFKDHGLDIGNACPFQTQVDKAHECQDAAQVLVEMYKLLRDQHQKTCEAARDAAAQAQRDCQSQESCMAAQQAALAKYQAALKSELSFLKDYADQADTSMNYAVKAIAGGGVWVLHSVKYDASKTDDGSHHYGLDGKGGAADFLQASSNEDAINNVMRGEDEARANAVVQKFLNNQGSNSDISGLKSPLIREPLAVAEAGRDWRRGLTSYQSELEGRTAAIQRQGATLRQNQQGLGAVSPKDTSTLSGTPMPSSVPAASSTPTSPSLAGLASAAQAASSIAKSAPTPAGASAAESLPSLGLGGSMNRPVAGGGPGSPLAADTPMLPTGAAAPSPSAPGVAAGTDDTKGSGSNLSFKSGHVPHRAPVAAMGSGASRPGGAAKGKAGEGGEASVLGDTPVSAAGGGSGGPGTASSSSSSEDGRSPSSFGSGSDLPETPKAVIPESNEKIVQGIVGDWEKALHPESSGEAAVSAPENFGDVSLSLFSRTRMAHERAFKRGSLVRTPTRL